VQFRLIAASNRDLEREVAAQRFRKDLYYRVSVTNLVIPPLRERSDDLPELVDHFTREVVQRHGLSERSYAPEVMSALAAYQWPGNIRELRNVLEGMILLSGAGYIEPEMLPATLRSSTSDDIVRATGALQLDIEQLEAEAIRKAICVAQGNLTQAARALRIARSTLYLKMKKYSLNPIRHEQRSLRTVSTQGGQ
jgi:DNA-binding NtrC family response regulator